jgi:hypothetical protein
MIYPDLSYIDKKIYRAATKIINKIDANGWDWLGHPLSSFPIGESLIEISVYLFQCPDEKYMWVKRDGKIIASNAAIRRCNDVLDEVPALRIFEI